MTTPPLNLLLITADQMRGDAMFCAGNRHLQTPHLDQLAYSGARFANALSESPVCVPARTCLMTGMSPWSTGIFDNIADPPPSRTPYLAQALRDAGYQTQAVGKLHVSPQRRRIGFDHVLLNEEGRREGPLRLDDYSAYLQEHGLLQRLWAHGMPANGLQSRPATLPEEHCSDAWTVRECCRFLDRRDPTAPFFLYASFRNPHPPLTPPQVYWDLYRDAEVREPVSGGWVGVREPADLGARRAHHNCDLQPRRERLQAIRAYYALITGIDHQIGVLLGELRERGLLERTLVVFTADHGEMLFDHGLCHKQTFYQGSARIPFIVRPPQAQRASLRPGQVIDQPVMLQDVMPTLLEAAGVPALPLDGRSVLPLMRDAQAPWREHAIGRCGQGRYTLVDRRHRYLYHRAGGFEQLFALDDADERTDLASSPGAADLLAAKRAALAAELARVSDHSVADGALVADPVRPGDAALERAQSHWNTRGLQFAGSVG